MSGTENDGLDPLAGGDDAIVGGEGYDPDAKKAELKRKRLGQMVLLGGGAAIVVVVLVVVAVRAAFSGGEKPVAVASVSEGAKVSQAPGAPDLPPATKMAFEDKNTQMYADAERRNQTSVGYTVFEPAPPPPPPIPVPVQAPQPVAQQAAVQTVPPIDEKALREAVARAIAETRAKATMDRRPSMVAGVDANGASAGGGIVPVNQTGLMGTPYSNQTLPPSGYGNPMVGGNGTASLGSGGGGSGGGVDVAGPHEAYGVTQVAADSDAPQEVVVEVLGGPFVGATVYGTPTFKQKSASVAINRMHWRGQDFAVKGFLLDADTRSPALPVDVDNYYFERVFLPALASGIGIAGKVAAQPVSTVQSVGTGIGGTIVTQTEPSTGRQIAGGFAEGGAGSASQILRQDAGEMKPTVRVVARQTVVVVFTSTVRSGDIRK